MHKWWWENLMGARETSRHTISWKWLTRRRCQQCLLWGFLYWVIWTAGSSRSLPEAVVHLSCREPLPGTPASSHRIPASSKKKQWMKVETRQPWNRSYIGRTAAMAGAILNPAVHHGNVYRRILTLRSMWIFVFNSLFREYSCIWTSECGGLKWLELWRGETCPETGLRSLKSSFAQLWGISVCNNRGL